VVLLVLFVRRYGGFGGFGVGAQILRVALASAAMGLACRALSHWLDGFFPGSGVLRDLVVTLPPVAAGVALYFGLSWLLRVEETQQGLRMLKRFTARLGPRRTAR